MSLLDDVKRLAAIDPTYLENGRRYCPFCQIQWPMFGKDGKCLEPTDATWHASYCAWATTMPRAAEVIKGLALSIEMGRFSHALNCPWFLYCGDTCTCILSAFRKLLEGETA